MGCAELGLFPVLCHWLSLPLFPALYSLHRSLLHNLVGLFMLNSVMKGMFVSRSPDSLLIPDPVFADPARAMGTCWIQDGANGNNRTKIMTEFITSS